MREWSSSLSRHPIVVGVVGVVVAAAAACGSGPTTSGGTSGIPGADSSRTPPGQSPASPGAPPSGGGTAFYGEKYEGGEFHLGPVDYEETSWHNACAPGTKYAPEVRQAQGELLAGLWGGIPDVARYCDACIVVTTGRGKSALLRVVTYGATSTNSIDVSPQAFALLDSGEYPRSMTWQLTDCPKTGPLLFEFQTGSSEYWTSLWVRNGRKPLAKVEVKSPSHAAFVELARGSDGTLTDPQGFGKGNFTLRLTAVDGAAREEAFDWPASGVAGAMLRGSGNLD